MNARPLKIGIACYPLIGGSGILATALGMALAQRGHEVHFFSYERPVRLDLAQPRLHFHEVVVNRYDLFKYPDYTLPLAVRMAEVARTAALDILHVHYAVPHATAAWLAVQLLRGNGSVETVPRIVTTLHGTDTTLLGQDPGYRSAIEHALVHSDLVTTVSESLRRQTHATFPLLAQAGRKIAVVPNFFTPAEPTQSRAKTRRDLGVTDDEFLIVHTSNLRPVKRIDLLLETVAAARAQTRARLRLLVLAGGAFAPYAARAKALGLHGDQVIVRENVLAVDDYLHAADVGIYPSENESFGLSILETMFHGRPVLAFRVGGIPEVVPEPATLPAFGDVPALAAQLDELAASPALAARLGARNREHAQRHFSAERIVPRYEAIYEART